MILDDNSKFGMRALTEAINKIPAQPTQIRELGIFEAKYLTTTYVYIEQRDGKLELVQSKPRGTAGDAVPEKARNIRTFKIPHLPVNDVVRADDVQNVRAFGGTQAETVAEKVTEKLADAKAELEMTREHLMLGALNGKILDADGSELYDLYKEFGFERKKYDCKLTTNTTEVGNVIDGIITAQRKLLKGAFVNGFVALCGPEFMGLLKYHPKLKALYERYREGALYREGNLNKIEFEHNGIKFVQYDGDFGAGKSGIAEDQAILVPMGRKLFAEYFAPADMNETVNSIALPYYASREKMAHDKGWSLHAQSNPLPVALRPDLVATLKASA